MAGMTGSAVAANLPKSITSSGELKIAITPNYPPLDFRDPATNELTGFDVDLAEAIGSRLGIKVKWQETSFSEMLSALQTGRVDAIMSGMTDLASRHDSATFIDYLRSGPQFFIQQARAGEFPDMSALCGKKVGASRRTSFPKEIKAWSDAHCASNPVEVVGTNGSADARTQLKQGRIDAAVQGNETLPYVMGQEPNAFKPVGKPIAYQFTGIAVPLSEKGFQDSVANALDALIADGTYKKLLDKWNLSDNGIEKATINAGK
jgi:polar amino acid transport system substrate-binding protein